MKMKSKYPFAAACVFAALSLAPGTFGQTGQTSDSNFKQTAKSDAKKDDQPIVVLSPFEVKASKDVGYLAQNTLAGSRLNTSLKDTAAAISVLTPEFLSDIAATSMKDVILFSNDAVPDLGDAAPNFNANPLIGNSQWQLRIRGLPASYARNYFTWETPTDFFDVARIDEARGPNAILFGFGSAGGIVNTTTKQAHLTPQKDEVTFMTGSWDRYRATIDANRVLIPGKLAFRLNAVGENSKSWREFEYSRSRRIQLASTWQLTKNSKIRAEFEGGRINDNIARPWLMIDQSAAWRAAGSPVYDSPQWSSTTVTQTWSEHMVYVENTGQVANWQNMPFSYSSTQNWAALAMTPANLAIVPMNSNSGGPAANRKTTYDTYSAFYENQLSDNLSLEIAYNHQSEHFLGYDPNAGNLTRYGYLGDATELWGDASSITPTGAANPYAGKFYVENNWTKRHQTLDSDQLRATMAYSFDLGKLGKHRLAVMYQRSWRDIFREEDSEVFLGSPFATDAEFDSNRVFRRYYFQPGVASDIRVPSWQTPLVNVTDPVSGKTLTSGWVPDQMIDNSHQVQDTFLGALQSKFFDDHLVSILGFRHDSLDYSTDPTVRDPNTHVLVLDPSNPFRTRFNANTVSLGAVYHLTKVVSLFANHSNSRNLPDVNQRVIGSEIPPMPKGVGNDFGVKLNLLDGRIYATVDYYTTKLKNTTEWGNITSSVTSLNTRVLQAFVDAGLISAADQTAHTIDANAYLEDRDADGWEVQVVANPTDHWRISANFSVNHVVKRNIMAEVKAWADTNTAYWLSQADSGFLLGGGSWDTLGNNIGWMNDYINGEMAFDGKPARGEREYGANLYSHYYFSTGFLKGWSIGGGGRYQSANIIGMSGDQIVKGRDMLLADASLGYHFKTHLFGRETPVDVQLNVNNVFDSRKYQIYTVAWWDPTATIPERIGLQEPRKFTLTVRGWF